MTWELVKLRDLGTWYGGGTPSKSNPSFWANGDVPWLSPKDMGPEVLSATQDHVTEAAVAGSSTKLVPAGSVAVVTRSGILERTIPIALVPFATTMNQDMKAVLPHEGIDARWIAWGLRAFEQDLMRDTRKAGTTVASIEMPRWYDFLLPVPPLDEQHSIVAILEDHLSRLDSSDASLAKALRRSVALERAALDTHFGVSGKTVTLDDLVQDISAGKSFGSSVGPATADEWGIIKVSAMTWGEFRADENKAVPADRIDPRFEIRQGDLLISRANTADYVGASVLVNEVRPRLLLSDKSLRVTPQAGVDSRWLWRVLQAPTARTQIAALATGTKDSMRNISQASLRKIQVPLHDEGTQQSAVGAFDLISEAVSGLRSVIELQQRRSTALRLSLLTAAFSGRMTGFSNVMSEAQEMVEA